MLSCQNDLEEIHSSPGSQLVNGCRGKPVTETSYGQVLLTCALLLQSCSCQEIVVRAGQLLHAPGVLQIQGKPIPMHPFVHPSSCSHSCIAEPTVLCMNAAGNHLHPTMLLSPRQAAASCFYTRLSSAPATVAQGCPTQSIATL